MDKSFGFSLIEVLVSLILLSLGLLSLESSAIHSLRETRAAYYFSVATQQLNAVVEQLRVQKNTVNLGEVLAIWNRNNKKLLPNGIGSLAGGYPDYSLVISWGKSASASCSALRLDQAGCITERVRI